MSPESFKYLLNVVGPTISKEDTRFRKAIPSAERLCLTLHYLAYGGSQQSFSFSFRIAKSTICSIISEICKAIWDCLSEQYVQPPRTSDDWKRIAKDFENIWNLPHRIGAIDGKHVSIKSPLNSGSLSYNYRGFFNMILMAIRNARYIFCIVDIGSFGSNNDSQMFRNSHMGKTFFNDEMSLPVAECLEDSPTFGKVPYFLVGDEAVPLQSWLLRPYSGQGIPKEQRIFNYKLSRARRVIENALDILAARWRVFMQPIQSTVPLQSWLHRPYSGQGIPKEQRIFNYKLSRARRVIENALDILAARWRVFMQPIQSTVEKTDRIVKAKIWLHNFLRQTNSAGYCPTGFVDSYDETGTIKEGEWRRLIGDKNGATLLQNIPSVRESRPTTSALEVRNIMKSYVNSIEGSVPWQWDHVRSRGDILANENS